MLLAKLKDLPSYKTIHITERKRIYSVFVECLENINRYTDAEQIWIEDERNEPYIYLINKDNEYVISTGNMIRNEHIHHLKDRLVQINQLDKEGLRESYENILDRESNSEGDGSGLGLITIGLKAKNKIHYRFTMLNDEFSLFEMKIVIKKSTRH
jgi:hypothetical protein